MTTEELVSVSLLHFKRCFLLNKIQRIQEIHQNFFFKGISFLDDLFPSEQLERFEKFKKYFQFYSLKYLKYFIHVHSFESWFQKTVSTLKKFYPLEDQVEFQFSNCLKDSIYIGFPFKFKIRYSMEEMIEFLSNESEILSVGEMKIGLKDLKPKNFLELNFMLLGIQYFYQILAKLI
jgi:hypothetical protein